MHKHNVQGHIHTLSLVSLFQGFHSIPSNHLSAKNPSGYGHATLKQPLETLQTFIINSSDHLTIYDPSNINRCFIVSQPLYIWDRKSLTHPFTPAIFFVAWWHCAWLGRRRWGFPILRPFWSCCSWLTSLVPCDHRSSPEKVKRGPWTAQRDNDGKPNGFWSELTSTVTGIWKIGLLRYAERCLDTGNSMFRESTDIEKEWPMIRCQKHLTKPFSCCKLAHKPWSILLKFPKLATSFSDMNSSSVRILFQSHKSMSQSKHLLPKNLQPQNLLQLSYRNYPKKKICRFWLLFNHSSSHMEVHQTSLHTNLRQNFSPLPGFRTKSKLDIATMSSTSDRKGCNKVVENVEILRFKT